MDGRQRLRGSHRQREVSAAALGLSRGGLAFRADVVLLVVEEDRATVL